MGHRLEDIARATGLELIGDGSLVVERAEGPDRAGASDLAIAMAPDYGDALRASPARAAVVWPDADLADLGLDGALIAPRARVALAHLTTHFQHPLDIPAGIHPTAHIADGAKLGDGVSVGPFAVINAGAQIGAGTAIGPNASVGANAIIGADSLIHAGARIAARCRLGARVIVHQNAVIGADGFSFEPPERGAVEVARRTGSTDGASKAPGFLRIHSLAAVEIGDDVEIGACTTIDRGTLDDTRVGAGTKIDNQVQIGHNVQIGRTCLICAQSGIAGSSTLGDRVVLGGKTGIADHVEIGSDVICAAASMVATRIPDGNVVMGMPATRRDKAIAEFTAIKRLPRMLEQVAEMRKKLGL